jgi:cation diffusion facilitator family transporter
LNDKERVALSSIAASAGLTIAKAIVGVLSGSLAILSEAAHSLIDFAATVMTYFAVRISGRPADEEHHYGHGKVESLSALAETALLFAMSGVVIWEAGRRLLFEEHHPIQTSAWAFGIIAGSVAVDFFRARLLYKVASDTSSEALEADALHFSSDMWSSLAVLIGLIAVAMGFPWADSAAALIVAFVVCLAGWRLSKRTIQTLTDAAPAGAAQRITAATQHVPGIVSVDRVRARPAGGVLFVDVDVAVNRTLPLDHVARIKDDVAQAIRDEIPNAEMTITTAPRTLDDETVMESIMVIARNRALAVHHVTIHSIGGKLSVSLDLEVDGSLPLGTAHRTATDLEEAVRAELGADIEVETHIEPLQPSDAAGEDATRRRTETVEETLSELAARFGTISDVHDVRVRKTTEGEVVNFHCYVDPALTVQEVHEKVDVVERALRRRLPTIKRVIGHAEPKG